MSFCLICALLVNIFTADTVYSQDTVVGVVGDYVVLPCASSKIEHDLQDITVLWRHNGSINVYAVIKGEVSVEDQDSKYKNRAETFPEEYKKGKFSLKLNNLTHTDAGQYQCYIKHSFEIKKVQLLINESAEEKEKEKQQTTEKEKKAEDRQLLWIKILIPVICISVVLSMILYVVYRITKVADKTSSSGVSNCTSGGLEPNQNNQDYSGLQNNL